MMIGTWKWHSHGKDTQSTHYTKKNGFSTVIVICDGVMVTAAPHIVQIGLRVSCITVMSVL